ncbi:MAG: serine--tRNA ligase [Bacteroidetes bacterium]|nr:serine--tRNA ligase [Bacteroidota bacterium]
MLDAQFIRDNPGLVRKAIADKNAGEADLVDRALETDQQRRASLTDLQTLQQQLNEAGKQIGPLMKEGKRDEAAPLIEQTTQLKEQLKEVEETVRKREEAFNAVMLEIPNIPHESVPVGHSPEENEVVFEWDELPSFDFEPKPHWELATKHGLIDFERGAKVTGAGFPFYIGKGARLQRALIQFFLDLAGEAGYTEMQPPLVINEASGIGTGQLPDKEGQMYMTEPKIEELNNVLWRKLTELYQENENIEEPKIINTFVRDVMSEGHDLDVALKATAKVLAEQMIEEGLFALYMIPTAEVPVTNFHRDEILDAADLPIKYAAYTPCFRREAGSYGKDVRGLNRLHQFDKVELVRFVHPDESYDHLEQLREDAERAVQQLGLPYRRVLMCTGDMGFTQTKKYDLEVWSAGQGRWLEVSSISNFEAFQARRANIRFRPEGGGKPQFVHTLNGSALALPRIVAALLENNQQADGSIMIPECLRRYTGFDRITEVPG